MNRFLWMTGNDKQRLRFAAALMFALTGPPILYYGTEVGLSQPRAKGPHREEARHPMLWGEAQDRELLAYFKQLIAMRRRHPALIYGDMTTLQLDDAGGLWVVERLWNADRVLVIVNAGERVHEVRLPSGAWQSHDQRARGNEILIDPGSVEILSTPG